MHDDVDAERERLADDRRHHCAVHAHQDPMPVRQGRERAEVRDAHQRVRGALRVNDLRAGRDCAADGLQVSSVDKAHLDAIVHKILCDQPVHPAVDVLVHEELIALPQEARDRVQRRHARREGERGRGLLQHRDVFLQGSPRWISRSRVVVRAKFAGRGLHERGRLVDRRVRWMVGVLRTPVKDHTLGGWLQLVLEGRKIGSDGERRQVVVLAPGRIVREADASEVQARPDGVLQRLDAGHGGPPHKEVVLVVFRAPRVGAVDVWVPDALAPKPPSRVFQAPCLKISAELSTDRPGSSQWQLLLARLHHSCRLRVTASRKGCGCQTRS
mmetsp:Transcript_4961/g.13682  ORF Transcript_4961/g.13682 Transcript_4961/m.13682 type:complete len:328 (+) Transcript_4961:488-1471(+)